MEQQSLHESLTFGISVVEASLMDVDRLVIGRLVVNRLVVGFNVVVEDRLEFLNFSHLTFKYEQPEYFELFNSFSSFLSESKSSSFENSGSLHLLLRFCITF